MGVVRTEVTAKQYNLFVYVFVCIAAAGEEGSAKERFRSG